MTFADDPVRFVLAAALAAVGVVLLAGGALGVVRFSDAFARLHALRALTWGAPFLLSAIAVEAWRIDVALRLALLAGAIAIVGPALTHLVAHAIHRAGVEPEARR